MRRITAPFYVMQSSGGVMGVLGQAKPVYMVESGPAAGVIAAGAFASSRLRHVISFDMGGTTAKVG